LDINIFKTSKALLIKAESFIKKNKAIHEASQLLIDKITDGSQLFHRWTTRKGCQFSSLLKRVQRTEILHHVTISLRLLTKTMRLLINSQRLLIGSLLMCILVYI
jgi:hypothetical protein